MSMAQQEQSIAAILQELAEQYDGIVSEREIFDRVLARCPSLAKDPYSAIREKLRYGATQIGWVRLGEKQLIPLRVALQDLQFRIIPDSEELAEGVLARLRFYPFIAHSQKDMLLEDASGHLLPTQASVRSIGSRMLDLVPAPALDLDEWFQSSGFELGDSIIVTIRHTKPLTLRLEHEPVAQFRTAEVATQEQELIDELVKRVAS